MGHGSQRVSAAAALAALALATAARAQTIEILSNAPGGAPGDGDCTGVAVSGDGRYVVFDGISANLAPTAAGTQHAFLLDRSTQVLEHLSVVAGGPFPNGGSGAVGSVSDDGRYTAFHGDMLLDWDFSGDVYVRDGLAPAPAELTSYQFQATPYGAPTNSGDGQYVAWDTSNNWFQPETTGVVVHRLGVGTVAVRQGSAGGQPSDSWVGRPFLSKDGRFVVYRSWTHAGAKVLRWEFAAPGSPEVEVAAGPATWLDSVDAAAVSRDGRYVVYHRRPNATDHETWLRDTAAGTDARVDPTNNGGPLASRSRVGGVTDDGRYVAFTSSAPNLVPLDGNGVSDAFVRDVVLQRTARISVGAAGLQANGATERVAIDGAGEAVVFTSSATNLVPGDLNGKRDVFRRTMCVHWYGDGDGDGWGAGPSTFTCGAGPAGQVATGGDCDDADPAVHPGAADVCNAVDDDCDGLVDEDVAGAPYCAGAPSTAGCVAEVTAVGCPSLAQPGGFQVRVAGIDGQRTALLIYGANTASTPIAPPNVLCVASPYQRLPATNSGGTAGACDGSLAFDFLAWAAAQPGGLLLPLSPGQQVCFQAWYRDPASTAGFRLSDGWATTIVP